MDYGIGSAAYFLEGLVIDETASIFRYVQRLLGDILAELPVEGRSQ